MEEGVALLGTVLCTAGCEIGEKYVREYAPHLSISPDGLGHGLAERGPPGRAVLVQKGDERLVRFPSPRYRSWGAKQASNACSFGGWRH